MHRRETRPGPARIRTTAGVTVAAATVVGLAILASTALAATSDQATQAEVYSALGVDNGSGADYVVLVDTSGSMGATDPGQSQSRYNNLREALTNFYKALGHNDRVWLIPFAGDAKEPNAPILSQGPSNLLVRGLPSPGGNTDIGRALAAAMDILKRPDSKQIAAVVLLTDGTQEPYDDSRCSNANPCYPTDRQGAWNDLARSYIRYVDKQSLSLYAIPLAPGSNGVNIMGWAFADPDSASNPKNIAPQVLSVAEGPALSASLGAVQTAVVGTIARSLVEPDLDTTIGVSWSGLGELSSGHTTVTLRLTSRTSKLPLEVGDLTVVSSDPAVTVSVAPTDVEIEPGKSADATVQLFWDAGARSHEFTDVRTVVTTLAIGGTVSSRWADVLAQPYIGVTNLPAIDEKATTTQVSFSAQRGDPALWYIVLAVVVVIVAAALTWLWFRRNPRVTGTVHITQMGTEVATLSLAGRRTRITRGPGIRGTGAIRGRWARPSHGPARLVLEITYRPDRPKRRGKGRPVFGSARCEFLDSVLVYGLRFAWNSAAWGGRRTPSAPAVAEPLVGPKLTPARPAPAAPAASVRATATPVASMSGPPTPEPPAHVAPPPRHRSEPDEIPAWHSDETAVLPSSKPSTLDDVWPE